MIVSEPADFIAGWVARQTRLDLKPPYSVLASIDAADRITAALIFQNWTGPDIEITVAADSIPRSLLVAGYRYAIQQCGCIRATFKTSVHNQPAIEAMKRLGAKLEGRQRSYYGDGSDALVFGILKEDFPYGFRHGFRDTRS